MAWENPPKKANVDIRYNYTKTHHLWVQVQSIKRGWQEPFRAGEPVFLNVYGAQALIPRNEFRQPK
jgi:hypothetical protein